MHFSRSVFSCINWFFLLCFSSLISSSVCHMLPTFCKKWSRGPSGHSLHHLSVLTNPQVGSCLCADWNWVETQDVALLFIINGLVGSQTDQQVCVFSGSFHNSYSFPFLVSLPTLLLHVSPAPSSNVAVPRFIALTLSSRITAEERPRSYCKRGKITYFSLPSLQKWLKFVSWFKLNQKSKHKLMAN